MPVTLEFQKRVEQIEHLIGKLESADDPSLRETVRELIQSLLELHGAGFERTLELISTIGGETGPVIIEKLGCDELVSSLLVLHGLHPDDFETRVTRALDQSRALLGRQGARLEIVAVTQDRVHVKIHGPASQALEDAVRAGLLATAPDAVDVTIEGGLDRARGAGFVPLTSLLGSNGSSTVAANPNRP